jgi:hypothetical protein
MTTDWMALFLAGLIGASVSWALCSLWTIRWIDRERRKNKQLADMLQNIEPADTPLMRELRRLQEQERFNRERA